ncbi:MAG: hypothetical protein LBC80_06775 [Treponema sp.]|jgi:hypothetical protein|nr:hypothetical protein [Treponema sp.]
MIGFLTRKTFYDMWDNLFRIVLLNLGFILIVALAVSIPVFAAQFFDSIALIYAFSALGMIICMIYLAAVSYSLKTVSDYGTFTFRDLLAGFKAGWAAGLVMGIYVFILLRIMPFVFFFYLTMEPRMLGLALWAILLWISIFSLLSFQYYFTVYFRLSASSSIGTNLKKAFKKCIIIALDNTGLSIFLFINSSILVLISVVLFFLFPGVVGVVLYIDEALRLRLLKYDYLESNPEANRRQIPWDSLLIEEREKTGTRSFRNFIFPWKD